ncbi:MAG: sensor domain-containing diguanylate cyclase [Desulfuromonas thiophila]|nr:sensor domain-containing diguanylate cyclase [Desulfuromonas thiophila]
MDLTPESYKQMLDHLGEAVYFVDPERRILYWNHAAELLTGYAAAELVGRLCADGPLHHVDEKNTPLCQQHCPLKRCIDSGEPQEKLVFLAHKQGQRIPVMVKTAAVRDAGGNILGAVEIFTDAAPWLELKEVESELRRQTLLDPLTGILTAQAFDDALQREWFRFKRYRNPFSLIALEVDYFRCYSQVYGRGAADRLLCWLVRHLRASLRRADVMGRIENDHFRVLLSYSSRKATLKVADMILELVRSEPCLDLPFAMSVSIGAVMVEDNEDLPQLLQRLDKALQRSKDMGHNQVTFWS